MTDTLLKMEYLLLPEMVKEAIKSLKPFHEKVSSALEDNSVVWFDADNPGLLTTDCLSTVENMQKKGFEIGHRETKLPENKRWIFVKRAAEPLKAKDTLSTIPKLMNLAPNSFNQNFGEFGTSPLFSMLTSGALGGGAGYLTGSLLERLFPERFVKRDRLNKTLGVIGALGGAAIPAYLGVVGMRNWDDKDKSKWNAWVKPNVFWGSQPEEKPQEKISEAINRAFEGIPIRHRKPSNHSCRRIQQISNDGSFCLNTTKNSNSRTNRSSKPIKRKHGNHISIRHFKSRTWNGRWIIPGIYRRKGAWSISWSDTNSPKNITEYRNVRWSTKGSNTRIVWSIRYRRKDPCMNLLTKKQ
jgi:hypothetical protein